MKTEADKKNGLPQKTEKTIEQTLASAARLIKKAGQQFEKVGLEIDFEIKIKAQRPIAFTTGRRIFIKDKLSPLKQAKK
ncbi:MAG: hypothetical protein LBG95_07010 [Treponema sp.]|jgi:hypothetical protein|nr:hypothetical protein [Treponema sp.]